MLSSSSLFYPSYLRVLQAFASVYVGKTPHLGTLPRKTRTGSCPSSLRLDTRGLPGNRHRGTKALTIGLL